MKTEAGGTRRSDYAKVPIQDPALLKSLLTDTLGRKLAAIKRRQAFTIGNVRVRLDEVAELGSFLEFEAVFEDDGPEAVARERAKVKSLMEERLAKTTRND